MLHVGRALPRRPVWGASRACAPRVRVRGGAESVAAGGSGLGFTLVFRTRSLMLFIICII